MRLLSPRSAAVVLLIAVMAVACDADAQAVYVTKTGKKYHRESCRYLRYSKIEIDLKEAKLLYTPCSVCNPTTKKDAQPASAAGAAGTNVQKPVQHAPPRKITATQCTATTKAGTRCKRTTTDSSRKCWQHQQPD